MYRQSAFLGVLAIAAVAGAATWNPSGGPPVTPAPDGTYTGDVDWITELEGDPPTETESFGITTPTGVLVLGPSELTANQKEQLKAAAPGAAQASVTISGGKVTKVKIH
ncbi:MAG: hypothetical protein ACT4PV_10790 [Planctomycetaceae bacterium]